MSTVEETVIEQHKLHTDSDYDYSDVIFPGLKNINRKIKLNRLNDRELELLGLNEIQINNLKAYAEKYGELASLYELNLVEGFDSLLIRSLAPYLDFEINRELHKITVNNLVKNGKHSLLARYGRSLQKAKGYAVTTTNDSSGNSQNDNTYLGEPFNLLFKYKYNFYDRLQFGFTIEKDAGEALERGFDFYSFFIGYKGKGFVKNLVIGRYNITAGQGLTLNSAFSLYNDPTTGMTSSNRSRVAASGSANESGGLKGVAATFKVLPSVDLTVFYSLSKRDGTIEDDSVKTVYETGLHRSIKELSSHNAFNQQVIGANAITYFKYFKVGTTYTKTIFSKPFKAKKLPYSYFGFRDKEVSVFGTDFSFFHKAHSAFGEFSVNDNGAKAWIISYKLQPSSLYGLSLLYRNYEKSYINFLSNCYSQNTDCSNEEGAYIGLFSTISPKLMLSCGADFFTSPWLKYRVNAPSYGNIYTLRLDYKVSRRAELEMRYSYTAKMQNLSNVTGDTIPDEMVSPATIYGGITGFPEFYKRHYIKLSLKSNLNNGFELRSRIDFSSRIAAGKRTTGFVILQDLHYEHIKHSWELWARYAIFDVDSYNDRLYVYEQDVLHSFTVPAYYDKGSRFYLMYKKSFNKAVDIWLRYSYTYFVNKQTVGTGYNEFAGNVKSDVRVQVNLNL